MGTSARKQQNRGIFTSFSEATGRCLWPPYRRGQPGSKSDTPSFLVFFQHVGALSQSDQSIFVMATGLSRSLSNFCYLMQHLEVNLHQTSKPGVCSTAPSTGICWLPAAGPLGEGQGRLETTLCGLSSARRVARSFRRSQTLPGFPCPDLA